MKRQFENKTGKIWLREDGILQLQVNEGTKLSKQNVAEFLAQKISWTEEKLPLIIDRSHSYSTSFDIVGVMEAVLDTISAVAYVVNTSTAEKASQLAKELFLEGKPVKIFYSIEEAVTWLKGIND